MMYEFTDEQLKDPEFYRAERRRMVLNAARKAVDGQTLCLGEVSTIYALLDNEILLLDRERRKERRDADAE